MCQLSMMYKSLNVAIVLRVALRKKSFLEKCLRTAHMHSPVSKRPINFIIEPRNILKLSVRIRLLLLLECAFVQTSLGGTGSVKMLQIKV